MPSAEVFISFEVPDPSACGTEPAGAWAIVFGLAWTPGHRWVVWTFGLLSAGMTFSCVFTRYHHAVDMPAGFLCGAAGTLIGRWLVGSPGSG